jgi:3-deoxy-D-manno-octulosonate cytidylyltransferase
VPEQEAVIGVIPARYGSTRFPGKPLALIAGRPMIQHVYERSLKASLLSRVVVATDDERIERAVKAFGGTAVMTSADHRTGTDRVAEVARHLKAPHYVNIQGDEPLVDRAHIDLCAQLVLDGAAMSTLVARIRTRDDLLNQNLARVVVGKDGHALMFSRSTIPFPRKYLDRGIDVDLDSSMYLRHVGVYGFDAATLQTITSEGESELESLEGLEMLRALYQGIRIKVGLVESSIPHVDVPEDIQLVEKALEAGERP